MKLKEYKYKINGTKFTVGVGEVVDNKVHVEVNGTPYDVELDDAMAPKAAAIAAQVKRPAAAPRTASGEKVISAPAAAPSTAGAITAPLPGTVSSIKVNVGDTITMGQTVATLEAMKMENEIHADRGGKVVAICVKPGDAVPEGGVLMNVE